VTGQDHKQPSDQSTLDPASLDRLSDEQLEEELTIAAYTPGRLRWERYQRLLLERLRRRAAAA
jgi:hypothetical protein